MLHPMDRQKRLPFFYRNNTPKIRRYSSEHCSDRTSKNLFCAAIGKEKDGTFFTSTEKYLTKSCNKYRK